jgi:carbonic anhydrase
MSLDAQSRLSRRRLLQAAGVGATSTLVVPSLAEALGTREAVPAHVTPKQALALLIAGNRRWVQGRAIHPAQSVARRNSLTHEQHPFATIVSCIDSRVPPELVFDRGIGDLAVIRTGAQVLDLSVILGSIEFAAEHLSTPLIVVMGHQRCGAVKAAIEKLSTGGTAPGHIQPIVDGLRPAYAVAVKEPGDLLDNMVRAQTKLAVHQLRQDPIVEELIARGELHVAGAHYSLDTGKATFIA